jgi:hypothetical protein
LGGGGGAGCDNTPYGDGGNGGKGIVIVRYYVAPPQGTVFTVR